MLRTAEKEVLRGLVKGSHVALIKLTLGNTIMQPMLELSELSIKKKKWDDNKYPTFFHEGLLLYGLGSRR